VNECMRIPFYREVVSTKTYETKALPGSPKNELFGISTYRWESTNKLLGI